MKRFIVQSYRRKYSFETLEEAKAYAQKVFQKSGVIVGIEETPQPTPARTR